MSRSPKSHYGNDEVCGVYVCVVNDLSSQNFEELQIL